uniref:NADH dehydrogenase subunit 2 n=1 Tax=Triplax ainonia TaxID=2911889 RepID=UPI0022373B65|nr:NADH dehydrogenase subunit 2 [Triplax ainonia]UYG49573.1 NADH dehydrogenase subunit 2 [Triplax ainonia]
MKFYKMMFLNTMITGTLITISSYSWFSMWMGLEINLLSIIPLITQSNNIYPAESAMKYFLTQVMASVIFLFSIILSLNLDNLLTFELNQYLAILINTALFIKMGAAPFHFWFPEIMEGLSWMNCLIMLTWQKIAPMVVLMFNIKSPSPMMVLIILSSTIIGSLMNLNQISLRKILAYSSINHISWMLSSMLVSNYIWMIYFLIYSIITVNIIIIFNNLNIFWMKQLLNSMNQNKLLKFLLLSNFISLGGLPPFLGFFPKWLTINSLSINELPTLSTVLIIFTLISLFIYLRLIFSMLMINTNENLKKMPIKLSYWVMIFNFVSLSALSFSPFILHWL